MPLAQLYIGPIASQLEFERRISAIGERPQPAKCGHSLSVGHGPEFDRKIRIVLPSTLC